MQHHHHEALPDDDDNLSPSFLIDRDSFNQDDDHNDDNEPAFKHMVSFDIMNRRRTLKLQQK